MRKIRGRNKIVTGILFLFFAACSQQPAEIHYQSDECAHCKMMIMDARFATQIVTSKGKVVKFDAIECMVAYMQQEGINDETAKFWVNDFRNPGDWIQAEHATFIKSEEIKSPMSGSLLALKSQKEVDSHLEDYPGEIIAWKELTAH